MNTKGFHVMFPSLIKQHIFIQVFFFFFYKLYNKTERIFQAQQQQFKFLSEISSILICTYSMIIRIIASFKNVEVKNNFSFYVNIIISVFVYSHLHESVSNAISFNLGCKPAWTVGMFWKGLWYTLSPCHSESY